MSVRGLVFGFRRAYCAGCDAMQELAKVGKVWQRPIDYGWKRCNALGGKFCCPSCSEQQMRIAAEKERMTRINRLKNRVISSPQKNAAPASANCPGEQ